MTADDIVRAFMRELIAERPRMSPALLLRIEERLRAKAAGQRAFVAKVKSAPPTPETATTESC